MNGYLVIGRAMHDDVPLGLCQSLEQARQMALGVTEQDVRDMAEALYRINVQIVTGVSVVFFMFGQPSYCETVVEFD